MRNFFIGYKHFSVDMTCGHRLPMKTGIVYEDNIYPFHFFNTVEQAKKAALKNQENFRLFRVLVHGPLFENSSTFTSKHNNNWKVSETHFSHQIELLDEVQVAEERQVSDISDEGCIFYFLSSPITSSTPELSQKQKRQLAEY